MIEPACNELHSDPNTRKQRLLLYDMTCNSEIKISSLPVLTILVHIYMYLPDIYDSSQQVAAHKTLPALPCSLEIPVFVIILENVLHDRTR